MVDPEEEQDFLVRPLEDLQLEVVILLQLVHLKEMMEEQQHPIVHHLAQQDLQELAEELAE
tara:strand:+ start:2139 stop:2321 length:183 start_codon:yes stop_codon:yes gene_type:complete